MPRLTGRPIIPGAATAEAAVSRVGFNAFASFAEHFRGGSGEAVCGDPSNEALYGRPLTGRALCAPHCVGSTSAGPCWEKVAELELAPAAVLLAGDVDSLTAGGLLLADIWIERPIICVDRLGPELLELVESGAELHIEPGGTVRW